MRVAAFTAERRFAPAASCEAASSSQRIPVSRIVVKGSRAERPRGSLLDYSRRDLDQELVATAILIIAIRRWLSPRSFTRPPIGIPCGLLSAQGGEGRAYHVSRLYLSGLGCASPPVARHLRQGNSKPLNLATCLLAQA